MKKIIILALLALTFTTCTKSDTSSKSVGGGKHIEPLEAEPLSALSGFNMGAQLTTYKNCQYLAYYDADHNMTIAKRRLVSRRWQKTTLPTKIGWDSHNYLTFVFDKDGYIHLSGNMHCVPLIYFRSKNPESIDEFEILNSMTGDDEGNVTYPVFMTDGKGDLIFHYRSGGSGNGYEVYNIYDASTKKWSRLLDTPLIDGKGERNAYMEGPSMGPDGLYHLVWVWRETSDCSTNHTLSYARSRDLKNWESIRGEKVTLPILLEHTELVVDPTPVKGGLFNGHTKLGFDSENRPVVGYHKYDEAGFNQHYVTRYENGAWKQSKLTSWDYRWDFSGTGSTSSELGVSAPYVIDNNTMAMGYSHAKKGSAHLLFDQKTLEPTGATIPNPVLFPSTYSTVRSKFPGMRAKIVLDDSYLARWDALPGNNDQKPTGELPPPAEMVVYKFK